MGPVHIVIDSRIRVPYVGLSRDVIAELKRAHTFANPDYHKTKARGFSTYNVPREIKTWREEPRGASKWMDGEHLSLPRGGMRSLREVIANEGLKLVVHDRRTVLAPVKWPSSTLELRAHQLGGLEAGKAKQQGIIRAPTGSGKTTMALALVAQLDQPALVIMRDSNLMKQWKERAVSELGLRPREIGIIQGGTRRIGARLTLALQQTLNSGTFPLETVAHEFGVVLVDEVQLNAARTFQAVIDVFPAKYRIGVSADETRKDKKEFLIYDQFGEIIHETFREDLERQKIIHKVLVRMVPTDFVADWYRDAVGQERDWNRLLEEIMRDEERNEILLQLVGDLAKRREVPVLIFTHRIEHAQWIADTGLFSRGITSGLLLGGGGQNAVRFEEDKVRLARGEIQAAAGTFKAIGVGIDVPLVTAGVMAQPIGKNRQFFGQVRGRICRTADGKSHATLYVLWDRNVDPDAPATYAGWNDGLVEIWDEDLGVWRPFTSGRTRA